MAGQTQTRHEDSLRKRFVLIGDPVAHSWSPKIFNEAFRALGMEASYEARKVPPDALSGCLDLIREGEFAGANVTIPHKQRVAKHVDSLSGDAAVVGAVNTIVVEAQNRLRGENTDIAGFLKPLREAEGKVAQHDVLILGSGGVARAAAYALLRDHLHKRLFIAARTPEKAEAIRSDFSFHDGNDCIQPVEWSERTEKLSSVGLIVNATPLGMWPHTHESPLPDEAPIASHHIVYDLVYNPNQTRLLKQAQNASARIITGFEMLLNQAAAAFKLWTGREMPADIVRSSLSP